MRRVRQAMWVPAVAVLHLSGCGGDDDAPAGQSVGDDDTQATESVGDDARLTEEGVPVATDLSPDDDLVAGMMASYLGPDAVNSLTEDERECMNQVLSPSFPTGLPPGLEATPEFQGVFDALESAAEACDVTL